MNFGKLIEPATTATFVDGVPYFCNLHENPTPSAPKAQQIYCRKFNHKKIGKSIGMSASQIELAKIKGSENITEMKQIIDRTQKLSATQIKKLISEIKEQFPKSYRPPPTAVPTILFNQLYNCKIHKIPMPQGGYGTRLYCSRDVLAKKPKAAKPKVAKPKVTKPKVAKPKVTKPKVAKPKVTKPKVAKPKVAKPKIAKLIEEKKYHLIPFKDFLNTPFGLTGSIQTDKEHARKLGISPGEFAHFAANVNSHGYDLKKNKVIYWDYENKRHYPTTKEARKIAVEHARYWHQEVIKDAIAKNKHIPPKILADYPELIKKGGTR